MKTLYIECHMGAAGDMLMAALYELLDNKEEFLHTMNHLGLPGVHVAAEAGQDLRHRGHPHARDRARRGGARAPSF